MSHLGHQLRRALAAPPLPDDFAWSVVHAAAQRRARRSGRWLMPLAAAAVIGVMALEVLPRTSAPAATSPPVAVAAVRPSPKPRRVDPAWSYGCIARGRAVRIAGPARRVKTPRPPSIRELRAALYGVDAEARRTAAASLAARSGPGAHDALVDALSVAAAAPVATAALIATRPAEAVRPVRRALSAALDRPALADVLALLPRDCPPDAASTDPEHARGLVAALADLGDTGAIPLLIQALERPALRAAAHTALRTLTGVDRGNEAWRWRCWLAGRARLR